MIAAPFTPSIVCNARQLALKALCEPDPGAKCVLALQLYDATLVKLQVAALAPELTLSQSSQLPGRPERPRLIHPAKVPRRAPSQLEGRAAMVHAIAHIEFNAINLALDAVWRFDGMPRAFYADWILVAKEEAHHFSLIRAHLRGMATRPDGSPKWDYGDFEAHDGLWEMCQKTSHDLVARMALVPRTLEARGLDATPQMQTKLRQVGTPDALGAADILEIILRDEIGHVAIGNHWYRWLCERDGHDPVAYYPVLTELFKAPRLRGPFNLVARAKAGFSLEEMNRLVA